MLGSPWYCDSCGRYNGITRYQCVHCRGLNTYDLCDQCILHAQTIHPYHSFRLVQSAGGTVPLITHTSPVYG